MRSNILLAVSLSLISLSTVSADYYVDSSRGSDSTASTSPAEAWKTLARTRKGGIKPGDTVRLACGGIWREQLVPVSGLKGKPVTYASYDPPGTKGLPPPAIQSSLDRSKPSDWKSVGEDLWATAEFSFEYWHAGETRDILFEGNICRDAGFGWGHDQRPDRNGTHILFYENKAATTNFVIRNNQFTCFRINNILLAVSSYQSFI